MTDNPEGQGGDAALPGVEHHRKTSRRLIRQARYELEKRGDRVQACDKASGAVAHGVKAAAEARGWRSDSHNYRRRIVTLLADEYEQPELNLMQDAADQLHGNFYEDMMQDWEVAVRLELLTGLLATFTELLDREPNPDFLPTPDQERSIGRLRLTEEEIAAGGRRNIPRRRRILTRRMRNNPPPATPFPHPPPIPRPPARKGASAAETPWLR